jgi:WD40-like Beta Propeller Repeat
VSTVRSKKPIALWAAGLVAVLVLGLIAVRLFLPVQPPRVTGSTQITHDGKGGCCVVTDGSRIYFSRLTSEVGTSLAQVSLNGGDVLETPSPTKGSRIMDISADHSQILIASGGEVGRNSLLWTVPLPAGSPRRLGSVIADARCGARWSPDGRSLVFSKGQDLWLAGPTGVTPFGS